MQTSSLSLTITQPWETQVTNKAQVLRTMLTLKSGSKCASRTCQENARGAGGTGEDLNRERFTFESRKQGTKQLSLGGVGGGKDAP